MAIRPDIAFGIKEPERIDVLGSIVRAAQAQNYLAQARENQAQADAIARKQRDDENLRGTMQVFGGDIEKALPEINKRDPMAGLSLQAKLQEMRHKESQARKEQQALEQQNAEAWAGILGPVKDQASYDIAVGEGRRRNLLTPEEAGRFAGRVWDEKLAAEVDQIRRGAATFLQQQEEARKAAGEVRAVAEEGRKVAGEGRAVAEAERAAATHAAQLPGVQADATLKQLTAAGKAPIQPAQQAQIAAQQTTAARAMEQLLESKRHNRVSEGLQARGQSMTDLRARELNQINRENKPPTAAERRAMTFYERAENAAGLLDGMEAEMASKGLFGQAWYNLGPNWLQSTDNQKYRQAQRAFTEARLRKDSGATIKESEYESDAQTYFPQPGDSKETLAQKKQGREAILRGLHQEAGRAARELDSAGPAAAVEKVKTWNEKTRKFE